MKKKKLGNYLFTGAMLTGIGLGFIFDNVPAGTLIGLGVGFGFRALPLLMERDTHLAQERLPEDDEESVDR